MEKQGELEVQAAAAAEATDAAKEKAEVERGALPKKLKSKKVLSAKPLQANTLAKSAAKIMCTETAADAKNRKKERETKRNFDSKILQTVFLH